MGCNASSPQPAVPAEAGQPQAIVGREQRIEPSADVAPTSSYSEAALAFTAEEEVIHGKALDGREARDGMMIFVLHVALVSSVDFTGEPIDMCNEFWAHHPHGKQPLLSEFVAVALTAEQIAKQLARIRLSSYRWDDIRGVGPKNEQGQQRWATPGNFGWFLALCKEHGWIGWLDFMSNVVVNVPAAHTVAYMGKLYAQCTVVPQGFFEPATLVTAMGRAWVFQETAFGPLDEHGARCLLASVRALGERVRAGEVEVLLGAFAQAADGMARLLSRRGWVGFLAAEGARLTTGNDYYASDAEGRNDEVMADTLVQRVGGVAEEERLTRRQLLERSAYPRDWGLYQEVLAMVNKVAVSGFLANHALDYFTRAAAANPIEPLVLKLLTTSRHEACATVDAFLDAFGLSILKAYGTLQVTFEADREAAVTEVARSILASRYGVEVGAEELLRMAWVRCAAFFKGGGYPSYAINGIQPTIPEGKRLLGLGAIEGTPILADSDGDPCSYKTASGGVHDTDVIMGSNLGLSFSKDGPWWARKRNGVFAGADGQRYRGFVCNPPPMLAAEGALKILVWRREGDPARLPAIVGVILGSRYSHFAGPPAAQDAAFD